MMDIWYTENHTDHVRMSMRVDKQLASVQSDFQRIDIFESVEFGRIMVMTATSIRMDVIRFR